MKRIKLYRNVPGGEIRANKVFFFFKMLELMVYLFPPGNEIAKSENLLI